MKLFRLFFSYIRYKLRARHRKGFGIHSPFMFKFVSEVIYGKTGSERMERVRKWNSDLKNDRSIIRSDGHGAGSHTMGPGHQRISQLARRTGITNKYGKLLYRIVDYFKPGVILELGTGLGVSTAYLAAANQEGTIISVEGDRSRYNFARNSFKKLTFPGVQFINMDFDAFLESYEPDGSPFLAFIDGNHTYEATLRYFDKISRFARHDTVLIIDDIHWSEGMELAWKEIISGERAVLSVDLFRLGIVFFREGVVNQDFIINF